MSATHLTKAGVKTWYRAGQREILLGDVADASNTEAALGVGFARYGRGANNDWIVSYDEALIVTKGTFSVRTEQGTLTARAGEVILLTQGTRLTYIGEEEGTEVVYVSTPHWATAQRASPHAALLDEFQPVE
jgi:ethanolamine utilization protein EutQ